MVLLKSFFKFIVNPLALVLLVVLLSYLSVVFIWMGLRGLRNFILDLVLDFEDFLGETWLGKRFSGFLDVLTGVLE